MRKRLFKQIVAFLLCMIMVLYTNSTAYAQQQFNITKHSNNSSRGINIYKKSKGYSKTIYVDGYRFDAKIDKDNTVILDGKNGKDRINLKYYENGLGTINLNGKNYKLNINSLTEKKVDIFISDNNKIVYQYNDIDEINSLNYEGQASVVIGGTAWILFTIALNALIVLGIINVVSAVLTEHGYDWYEGEESVKAIAADTTLQKYYYPALIKGGTTLIALYSPLSEIEAGKIVVADKIIDLYSFTSNMAKSVIASAGFSLESQTFDFHGTNKGLQFRHYHKYEHKFNMSDFHSLYGTPTLVK